MLDFAVHGRLRRLAAWCAIGSVVVIVIGAAIILAAAVFLRAPVEAVRFGLRPVFAVSSALGLVVIYYFSRRYASNGGFLLQATAAFAIVVGLIVSALPAVGAVALDLSSPSTPIWWSALVAINVVVGLAWWAVIARVAGSDALVKPVALPVVLAAGRTLILTGVAPLQTVAGLASLGGLGFIFVVGRRLLREDVAAIAPRGRTGDTSQPKGFLADRVESTGPIVDEETALKVYVAANRASFSLDALARAARAAGYSEQAVAAMLGRRPWTLAVRVSAWLILALGGLMAATTVWAVAAVLSHGPEADVIFILPFIVVLTVIALIVGIAAVRGQRLGLLFGSLEAFLVGGLFSFGALNVQLVSVEGTILGVAVGVAFLAAGIVLLRAST